MKRIIELLDKYSFGCLTAITIVMFLYCCDIPVCSQHFWFLVNHKNEGDLLYNIGVSYISAYIFYILQVFIPDKKKKYDEIYNNLPKRLVVSKEVKQFLNMIISLWTEMYVETAVNKKQDLCVSFIFENDNIDNMSSKLKLYGETNQINIDHMKKTYRHITWIEKIENDTSKIMKTGEYILRYYGGVLPGDVYNAFYKIINSSMMVKYLNLISRAHLGDKQKQYLNDLIGRDPQSGKIHDFSDELEAIKSIANWLNLEVKDINNLYHDEVVDGITVI